MYFISGLQRICWTHFKVSSYFFSLLLIEGNANSWKRNFHCHSRLHITSKMPFNSGSAKVARKPDQPYSATLLPNSAGNCHFHLLSQICQPSVLPWRFQPFFLSFFLITLILRGHLSLNLIVSSPYYLTHYSGLPVFLSMWIVTHNLSSCVSLLPMLWFFVKGILLVFTYLYSVDTIFRVLTTWKSHGIFLKCQNSW